MLWFYHLIPLVAMQLVLMVANGYDVGCLIGDMPHNPLTTRDTLSIAGSKAMQESSFETPIVIYNAHRYAYCQSGCTAYHSSSAKMPTWEDGEAPFRVPEMYHETWSRIVCLAQCWNDLFQEVHAGGEMENSIPAILDDWNFPRFKTLNENLIACDGDSGCIEGVVIDNDWDPRLIGQVVFLEVQNSLENDGWNHDGKLTWDWESGKAVPCTANCAPFSDTTGYYVKNQPQITNSQYKFNWRPIQENDGNGYFSRQEHVTPHIGHTVKPVAIKEWKVAPAPEYDYAAEGKLLSERGRNMVSSQEQKDMIVVYDDKLTVREIIQHYMIKKYFGRDDFIFEDYIYFLQGIDLAEHDSLVQAWREKVNHDLIRPTTYVQQNYADKENLSYGGDPDATEPVLVKGRDFQTFIRVMPHSEYPSGSGCLCLAYQEYTEAYLKDNFGDDTIPDMSLGLEGVVNVDGIPSHILKLQEGSDSKFYIGDLKDLTYQCGQSRLWGGMHFTQSVDVTHDLCSGIGDAALEVLNDLKGTGEWGKAWKVGDPRPICPSSTHGSK